jgi:ubiquinone/menaquinone biosynthesis C-methylase UbiE
MIAELDQVDRDVIVLIYEHLLKELKNPYLAIESLIIRSIDVRLAKIAIERGDRVLNIGCGYPMAEIIFNSWGIKNIVGVDVDDKIIQKGRKWLDDLGVDAGLYQGNAISLDFPKESFDAVLSFSAIEHVKGWENYERWIENMSNVTKRSVVLTTSNRKNFILHSLGQIVRMEGYEHFFTRQEIESLLFNHGLKVTHFDTNALWFSGYVPYIPGKFKYNKYALRFDLFMEKFRKNVLKSWGGRMGFVAEKVR